MTRQPAPQQHKLKHFEEAVLPCWLCPVMQGRASQIDCAVTERYRAVTFRPEFAVLVEFCAADKFHYTRAADTVNTVKISSLPEAMFVSRLKAFLAAMAPFKVLQPQRIRCFRNSKKPFKGLSSGSNIHVEVEGPFS